MSLEPAANLLNSTGKSHPVRRGPADPWMSALEQAAAELVTLEAAVAHWIRLVGVAIDVFGVIVIVCGILWSTLGLLFRSQRSPYDNYRIRIGRTLLLGLEILVAADIVKTVALEPTFASLGVLAGLVLVRTFLSWTLALEIEGRWPWRMSAAGDVEPRS